MNNGKVTTPMIKAVLFDLDGTVIDSEPIHKLSWERLLAEKGYPVTSEMMLNCIGLNDKNMEIYLRSELGDEFEIEPCRPIATKYSEDYIEENGIEIKKGFFELIDYLEKSDIKRIIVTSSPKRDSEHVLKKCGILQHFDGIIGGDNVPRGKPFPDPYEMGVKLSGFSAEECLVIEDSENGIKSSAAAGVKCVYIKDMRDIPSEVKPLIYSEEKDLSGVIGVIKALKK